jgi:hypothetical protein
MATISLDGFGSQHVSGEAPAHEPPWPLLIRVARGLSVLLACGYLLQIATPFRLNTDSIRLHYMAIGLQEGIGLYGYGETQFPPVFPIFLAAMEWGGIANGHMFVVVNLLALLAGWVFTWQLLRAERRLAPDWRWLVLFLTLASWVVVKHVTLTLTDIPYFAVSAAALLGIQRLSERGHPHFTIRAIGVAAIIAIAIGIRTHGISLLPAFVFVIGQRLLDNGPSLRLSRRAVSLLAAGGCVAVTAVICIIALASTDYGRYSLLTSANSSANRIGETLGMRAGNFAELASNVPQAKATLLTKPFYTFAGSLCIACFAVAFIRGLRTWRASDIYISAYLAILAVWPFSDARFLLPIIPLMWSTVLCQLRPQSRTGFLAAASAVAWFAITGGLALGFSSRITFAGDNFPNVFSAVFKNTYRSAYGQPEDPSADPTDPRAQRLIRRYQFGDSEPSASALAPSTP